MGTVCICTGSPTTEAKFGGPISHNGKREELLSIEVFKNTLYNVLVTDSRVARLLAVDKYNMQLLFIFAAC